MTAKAVPVKGAAFGLIQFQLCFRFFLQKGLDILQKKCYNTKRVRTDALTEKRILFANTFSGVFYGYDHYRF